jgi:hypothetical protein
MWGISSRFVRAATPARQANKHIRSMKNNKRLIALYESIRQDLSMCNPYGKPARLLEYDGKQYDIELNDVCKTGKQSDKKYGE